MGRIDGKELDFNEIFHFRSLSITSTVNVYTELKSILGENGMYTKHKIHFVYEYKKSYIQKVKTECTQTIHKPTYPNIDEIEPNYDF